MSRHTKRPEHPFNDRDFFAEDVRAILKSNAAPTSWGDEEALFLFRVATDPNFMDDAACFLDPKERHRRTSFFASLCVDGEGKVISILGQIDGMVKSRIARKGNVSCLWLVVANFGLRNQELTELEAAPPSPWKNYHLPHLRKEVEFFWEGEAKTVADEFSKQHGQPITAKTIEKARRFIRDMKPFGFPPREQKK